MVFALAACGEKEPEPVETEPVETEPQLTPEEIAENVKKKVASFNMGNDTYELLDLTVETIEKLKFTVDPIWYTNTLEQGGPIYKNKNNEQFGVLYGDEPGDVIGISVGTLDFDIDNPIKDANIMFVNGIKTGMTKSSVLQKLKDIDVEEQNKDGKHTLTIQTDVCTMTMYLVESTVNKITLVLNEDQIEYEKPEADSSFANFTLNGEELDMQNLTFEKLSDVGFAKEGQWRTSINSQNIKGYRYVTESMSEIYLVNDMNKIVGIGTGYINKSHADLQFIGGLTIGMTMSEVWPLIQAYQPIALDASFPEDCNYLVNNGDYTMILRMKDGSLFDMYLFFDAMFTDETDKIVRLSDAILDGLHDYNAPESFPAFSTTPNYEEDISAIKFNSKEMKIVDLTTKDLIDAEYIPESIFKLYDSLYARYYKNEDKSITIINNADGKVELMIVDSTSGDVAEFFGEIKVGMDKDALTTAINNKKIKFNKDKTTGIESATIKTEEYTLIIDVKENLVDKITMVNNSLLTYEKAEGEPNIPANDTMDDVGATTEVDLTKFAEFKLNGKSFTLGQASLDDIKALGYQTSKVSGQWINNKNMSATGVIYINENNEQIKVSGKTFIVVGAERYPFANKKHADLELVGGLKIGTKESEVLKVLSGLKYTEVSDEFCTVYTSHYGDYSLIINVSDGIVQELYLAVSVEVGLNLPYRLQLQGINDRYHEELYTKNDKQTWYGYSSKAEYEVDFNYITLNGKTFTATELTLIDLADLGYTYQYDITTSSKPQYLGMVFANEYGEEIHVITNKQMQIECFNVYQSKNGAETDCVFFGGLKIGMKTSEVQTILNSTKITGDCKVTIKTTKNTMTVWMRNGVLKDVKLVNNDIATFPPVKGKV